MPNLIPLKKELDRQALVLFTCTRLSVRLTALGCSTIFNRPVSGKRRSYYVKGPMGKGSIEFGSYRPKECEGCPIGAANLHVFEFNQSVSDDAITLERIDEILDALRKLVQKHHPDKPGGDEKTFKELRKRQRELKKARKLMVTALKEQQ